MSLNKPLIKQQLKHNKMRTHFYNAKVNGIWQEVVIESERGDKKKALEVFRKYDKSLKLKDVYSSVNAPDDCPITFKTTLN